MSKLEKLKKLIEEGKQVLLTSFEQDDGITRVHSFRNRVTENHCPVIRTYVETDLFNKWYEKTRLFLVQNSFQDSFINSSRLGTNYDITKEQVAVLEAIYEHLDDNNNSQCEEFWGYLPDNIKQLFNDGHYKQAVLDAFIYLEDQVRKKSALENYYGTDLMRKAFHKETGALTNKTLPDAEREAQSNLFAGAIGFIKNPKSHNMIEVKKEKAIELLHLANYLIRILDGDYSKRL